MVLLEGTMTPEVIRPDSKAKDSHSLLADILDLQPSLQSKSQWTMSQQFLHNVTWDSALFLEFTELSVRNLKRKKKYQKRNETSVKLTILSPQLNLSPSIGNFALKLFFCKKAVLLLKRLEQWGPPNFQNCSTIWPFHKLTCTFLLQPRDIQCSDELAHRCPNVSKSKHCDNPRRQQERSGGRTRSYLFRSQQIRTRKRWVTFQIIIFSEQDPKESNLHFHPHTADCPSFIATRTTPPLSTHTAPTPPAHFTRLHVRGQCCSTLFWFSLCLLVSRSSEVFVRQMLDWFLLLEHRFILNQNFLSQSRFSVRKNNAKSPFLRPTRQRTMKTEVICCLQVNDFG